MKSGIYRITNPEGKLYIGATINLKNRWRQYWRLRSVLQKQRLIYDSLLKFGYDNHVFEVLEYCNIDILAERERFHQDANNAIGPNGLNLWLTKTKDNPRVTGEASRKKFSDSKIGSKNGMYGRRITESAKMLQREKLSGAKNYLYKPILHTEYGIFYDTLKEAGDAIGMDRRMVWQNISGKAKKNRTPFVYA